MPGMSIAYYSRLPHIGGDIIFALVLGTINFLVFPVLRLFHLGPSHVKIGLITFVISFVSYALVNILPVGIKVTSGWGYLIPSLLVWVIAYITNHIEYRHYLRDLDKEIEESKHHEDS